MPSFSVSSAVLTIAIVLLLARPAHAFGAGNIQAVSKIEGSNWRHGDIEDTLLTLVMSRAAGGKKWDKMNVARTYFGNWLRDYSQAIDVGTVKYVSAEAIRILLWVLGFMTFGFGTKEFEVTTERLGCYRPEDHIDNPKDYADNEDATQYDRRLRAPVNERVELAIDEQTGLKNYIANERAGIMTSAKHLRNLFGKSIELGRSFARSNNKAELYEALRLLGTGLHCLEDYSAHSNYTELALIEMGERDVFPHVGSRTQIRLQGARGEVFPIVTGTFGGVDFLHSVCGEISDKATQSEIEELEGTMQQGSRADNSALKDLLSKIPSGIFGGKDEAGKADELQQNATAAQMNQARISPRDPEAFTQQMQEIVKQIFPIIEWHDEVMLSITETIEAIPLLPELLEQVEGEVTKFVFSLLAPFVLPIISQVKAELSTGSSEIIQSSKDKQLIVFEDDNCTDPTHSMLSKDHFSNVLNEPAGKIASQVVSWVVPQLIAAWDDESVDVNRTITRIINGVFHHPAQRNLGDDGASDGRQLMFRVVETWWREQDQGYQRQLRQKLSRQGIQNGENHKEGVHDHGHGCGKPLGMHKVGPGGGKGSGGNAYAGQEQKIGKFAEQAVGGGALGGLVGALAGGIGGDLLSSFSGGDKKAKVAEGYTSSGNYQQSYTETAQSGNRYGQAQVTETQYSGGGRKTEYSSYENTSSSHGQSSSGYGQSSSGHGQTDSSYGRQERRKSNASDEYKKEKKKLEKAEKKKSKKHADYDSQEDDDEPKRYGGGNEYGGQSRRKSNASEESYKKEKKDKKHDKEKKHKKHADDSEEDDEPKRYGGGNEYGSGRQERRKSNDSDEYKKEKKRLEKEEKKKSKKHADRGYEEDEQSRYSGGGNEYGSGRQEQQSYGGGGNEYGSGRQEQQSYGGGGNEYGSGRREEQSYGGGGGGNEYGSGRQEQQSYGGGGNEYGSGRQEQQSYGGGGNQYGSVPGGFDEQEERQAGGYGQQSGGYGERRERRDDEEDDGGRRW